MITEANLNQQRFVEPPRTTVRHLTAGRLPGTTAAHALIGLRRYPGAPPAPPTPPGDPPLGMLSPRERQVVFSLCEGLTRDAIADRLAISRSTLDKTISEIYAGTGFCRAYQLVAWAFRCGVAPRAGT